MQVINRQEQINNNDNNSNSNCCINTIINSKEHRKIPRFDKYTNQPILTEEEKQMKCYCTLCLKGSVLIENILKRQIKNKIWISLIQLVFECMKEIQPDIEYFSLKYDIFWFIHNIGISLVN